MRKMTRKKRKCIMITITIINTHKNITKYNRRNEKS